MKKLIAFPVAVVLTAAGVLGAGGAGEGGGEDSQWCVPGDGAPITDLDEDQSSNARTIVTVGEQLGVPDFGLAVALATAAQESTLRNLDHGDRDSVGLFQQRAPWGTFEERTHPPTSSRFFYTGGAGGQPGLLDIPGWEHMPLTEAAQAVQVSAYPDAYATWEDDAWTWLAEIRGDLAPQPPDGGTCDSEWSGEDPPPLVADPAALMARAQAFADANAAGLPDPYFGATHYYRLCAQLAARVHGRQFSGFVTALDQWRTYVATGAAVTDGSPPPPGALLFYDNVPSGHVAVYLGDGLAISNDVLDEQTGRRGGVYIVPTSELTDGAWNLPYAGWAPPTY
ncbi:hypothetical protein [Jiangella sp. DSM 45060]|uniref:hypothetical protein n=1 Tax=Jiangella sp. DSM 45060 TaxID=1798224 RepID=UPI00087A64FF|nr:hypothetical protein [Jiangella sp. DSM 45060]SDT37489.1 hypothetical protein SAMN04515669_3773 [Jiangella sp. DSM 45060]